MAGIWGNRKKEREAQSVKDAEETRRAGAALVAIDERIRTTSDELVYAEAELGTDATRPVREALDAVRQHLAEAFHLHQLNHDDIPDTSEELRTRSARILQLCEWAEELLDDRTEALAGPIERARRAPEIIAGIRSDAERLSTRMPQVKSTLDRLRLRYSAEALRKVSGNHDEARQLLEFALHGAEVSERRRESGQREQANLALETAIEAVPSGRIVIFPVMKNGTSSSTSKRVPSNSDWIWTSIFATACVRVMVQSAPSGSSVTVGFSVIDQVGGSTMRLRT